MTPEPDSWEILAKEMRKYTAHYDIAPHPFLEMIDAWAARVEALGKDAAIDGNVVMTCAHDGSDIISKRWDVIGGYADGMMLCVAVTAADLIGLALGRKGESPPFVTLRKENWEQICEFVDRWKESREHRQAD